MADEIEINNSTTDGEESELKVYELGFHILPSVPNENVGAEFSKVKSAIEDRGGSFISEEFPKLRPLAYQISKGGRGGKQKYNQAYFSWIKFQAEPTNVLEIKKTVEGMENILRFILIKTIKESTLYSPKPSYLRSDPNRIAKRNQEEKEKAEKPISEAELDKTIEELVIG